MQKKIIYVREIISLMGNHKKRIPILILFGLILGITDVFGLGLVAQFVGSILNAEQEKSTISSSLLKVFANKDLSAELILIPLFILRALLGTFSYWYINHTGGIVEANLRADLLIKYQKMPYADRLKRSEAEFINTINVWTTQYSRFVLIALARVVSEAIISLMVILYLAYLNWFFFSVFLVLICSVAILYDFFLKKRGQDYARKFRALSSQVVSDVQQCLEGYKEIRVIGLEDYFQKKLRRDATEICSSLAKANTISQSPRLIIEAVVVVFVVISLTLVDKTINHATHSLPLLAAFAVGGIRIISLASLISSIFFNLRLYRPIVHQLLLDYSITPAASLKDSTTTTHTTFAYLEVRDLSFSHIKEQTAILKHISFTLRAGENMVIVGPSGCGKTTLVDLLLGIIQPDSGTITVHCKDHSFRSNLIGIATYLSQTTFILNDSLRRNIALGEDDATIDDKRIMESLDKAKLPEFRNNLDMTLGDRGNKISGGQRQRVALARAFYLGRNVLILDEATNALDLQTETEIIKDLLALKSEITLILITHRPEIAKLFSCQLRLSNGQLA